jgi:hypothetical protein
MADRIRAQLTAVRKRVEGQPEAGFLVGPRVTHEPKNARLRGPWQPGPRAGEAGSWQVPPGAGTTLDGIPADLPGQGTLDLETVSEAAAQPESGGYRGTGEERR